MHPSPSQYKKVQDEAQAQVAAAALRVASRLHELRAADETKDTGQADRIAQDLRLNEYPYMILTAQRYADTLVQAIYANAQTIRDHVASAPAKEAEKKAPAKKN